MNTEFKRMMKLAGLSKTTTNSLIIKEDQNTGTINVPQKYKYLVMQAGSNPPIKKIMDLYREYTKGGDLWEPAPLKRYDSNEDKFYNEVDEDFTSDSIFNFINNSIAFKKGYDDDED